MFPRVPTLHSRMQVRQLHAPGRAGMRGASGGEQWLDRRGALRQLPPTQRGDRRDGEEVDALLGGTETEIVAGAVVFSSFSPRFRPSSQPAYPRVAILGPSSTCSSTARSLSSPCHARCPCPSSGS